MVGLYRHRLSHSLVELQTIHSLIVKISRLIDKCVSPLATGPHTASFLNVQSFWTSSKKSEDGQRLKNGRPSTHYVQCPMDKFNSVSKIECILNRYRNINPLGWLPDRSGGKTLDRQISCRHFGDMRILLFVVVFVYYHSCNLEYYTNMTKKEWYLIAYTSNSINQQGTKSKDRYICVEI